jgi:hypothetical protein
MTATISLLLAPMTEAQIWASTLSIAAALELDVDSWKPLDPSKTLLHLTADLFSVRMDIELAAVKGGFLDDAEEDWIDLLVAENYTDADGSPILRIPATHATGDVELVNAGGANFDFAIGEVTFQNSTTKATYRNAERVTLVGGATDTFDIIADVEGSGSTSSAGDIDTIVSPTMIGVSCANADSVVGVDREEDAAFVDRARDSLGALSPNGPKTAYDYVAKSTLRSDGTPVAINRTRFTASGNVVSGVIASPTGAPTGSDVTDVDNAIQEQCVPLGVTCTTVTAATEVSVAITYTAYVPSDCPSTDDEIKAAVVAALTPYFATYPIDGYASTGGGQGYLYAHLLRGKIQSAEPQCFSLTLAAPAADVALTGGQVPTQGAITATITRVPQ